MREFVKICILGACVLTLAACQTTSANRAPQSNLAKFNKPASGVAGTIQLAAMPNWTKPSSGKDPYGARGAYICPKEKCDSIRKVAIYSTTARKKPGNLDKIKDIPPTKMTTTFALMYALRSSASKKSKRRNNKTPISYALTDKAVLKNFEGYPGWGSTAFVRPKNKSFGLFLHSIIVFDEVTQHIFYGLASDKKAAISSANELALAWRPPAR